MARLLNKKPEEIGLSPDTFRFYGEKKTNEILISVLDYNKEFQAEKTLESILEIKDFNGDNSTTWVNIDGLHDEQVMKDIANEFNISSLMLSDIMNTNNPPRIVEMEDCIFISLKVLRLDEKENKLSSEQLSIIITPNILFTFQEKPGNTFDVIKERIKKQNKRIISSGTDYLAFSIIDVVVDNYILLLTGYGIKIEAMEDRSLVKDPDPSLLERINYLKRELVYFRKNIKPAREIIILFSQIESGLIKQKTNVHLKELANNINHVSDSLDSYREILSDQLNIYHTRVNSKLNDIMKLLTIFSVIFIPLTFLVGVYGMNFKYFPEIYFRYSYFILWGVMLVIAGVMLYFFRKKKWI